jgi:FHS family L-fucose permease-like MFS transporter
VARRLWDNRHYRYGVIAQFFNVAAQTCVWTFTIIYAQDVVGVSPESSGWYLQASLILFLVSRFVMVWLLGIFRPALLLLLMAGFGVACCLVAMLSLNIVGLLAVVAISASLSLMFPTIYGVALHGLGDDAKFGAAGLVMAILGGPCCRWSRAWSWTPSEAPRWATPCRARASPSSRPTRCSTSGPPGTLGGRELASAV